MAKSDEKPTCFIAMPITTQPEHVEPYGGDDDHWAHVMVSLFEKAVEEAGFRPIRPAAQGAHLIHASIIRHLSTADLVLVDLSTHNPNVFFELGVRTSLDLPIALVRDEQTNIPFDTSGINTYQYDSNLRGWELEQQRHALTLHIEESYASCAGKNPLWQQFGLNIKASEPNSDESPREAKLDLIVGQLGILRRQMDSDRATLHAATQERLEEAAAHARYQSDGLSRRDIADHVLDELRNILESRNADDRPRLIGFERVGPDSFVATLDSPLPADDIKYIRRLEQSSGIELRVRVKESSRALATRQRTLDAAAKQSPRDEP